MQEKLLGKLNQITGKLKEISSKLDKRNRILVIGAIVLILAVAIVGAVMLNSSSQAVLFTELTQEEASEIVAKIGEMGLEASYSADGTVSVPAEKAEELRVKLVMEGYPQSGLSYKRYIDNVSDLSTDFDKNMYAVYDLQDRVASSIRSFDGVQNAVVSFAVGSEDRYVLNKDKKDATAWATIDMKPGAELDEEQVKGIQRLLAKSVSGLKEENIAVIVDGRDLAQAASTTGTNGTAKLKRALELEVESGIASKIMYLLTPVYGDDNVRVTVSADVDVKKKLQESITYTPATDDNKGVTKSQSGGVEITGNGQTTGGTPGTDTNAVIPEYPTVTFDGENIYYRNDEDFEYLVSQMTEQVQDDGGDVLDLSVSAVINESKLSATEITDIRRLIAQTSGIGLDVMDQKVTVMAANFVDSGNSRNSSSSGSMETLMQWKWLILAFIIFAIVLTLIVSKTRGRRAEQLAAEAGVLQSDGSDMEPEVLAIRLEELKKTREMELKEQVKDFAESNPEISAQLIRTWLKGGEEGDD